jgi:hypothetical protein
VEADAVSAVILQFPLQRRLSPDFAQIVETAVREAEARGEPCNRELLMSMADDFNAGVHEAQMERIRQAIAALPRKR